MGGVGSGAKPGQGLGLKRGPYKGNTEYAKPRYQRKTDRPYVKVDGSLRRQFPGAYATWNAMKSRCRAKPGSKNHEWYIGIEIRYENFAAFVADLGERPPGMLIDRIDPRGHYEQGNCRWADSSLSARNKRVPNIQNLRGGLSAVGSSSAGRAGGC